jgi:dipeptidyl aminopeptidase/acylaminoacyl peptidase
MATPQAARLAQALPDGRVLIGMGERTWEVRGKGAGQGSEIELSWLLSPQAFEISSDGHAVVVTANAPAHAEYLAHLVRFDGRPPVRLGDGAGNGLSPDGRWVATLVDRYTGLVLLPTGPGEARRLPRTLEYYYDVRFLPDGERLLVAGNAPGRPRRLFVLDLRGGPPRPVTPEGVTSEYPIPSPDGRWVAAGTNRRTAAYALYPLEGGEARPIPGLEPGQEPLRFDGSGSHLFVRIDGGAGPSARIARLDVRTGRREPWLEVRPPDVAGVPSIFVVYLTPDGRSYVYSFARRLSSLYLVEGLR